MTGLVADGEHFVAQRRYEQQVHLREDAGHFLRYFAAEAVGLDEIHGGEEARLAEKVGPGVRCLDFELVDAVAQGELLESGGGLGEENHGERGLPPNWERRLQWDQTHTPER